jgi:hypothetical protein
MIEPLDGTFCILVYKDKENIVDENAIYETSQVLFTKKETMSTTKFMKYVKEQIDETDNEELTDDEEKILLKIIKKSLVQTRNDAL